MNIESKKISGSHLQLTLKIEAGDYNELLKNKLKSYKDSANLKGFRQGKVPMSIIEKIYGEQALVYSINEVISKSLNEHIENNKLQILGEPISSEEQEDLVWEKGNDFTFKFDLALRPEIKIEIDKTDSVTAYEIEISAEDKKKMKESFLQGAEANQETFDKLFGKDKVTSEEEFDKKVEDLLRNNYSQDAEYKKTKDIKDYFIKKASITLAEEILKRQIEASYKEKHTEEQLNKEFEFLLNDLHWSLVRDFCMKKFDLKVEKEDLDKAAEDFIRYQYAMYGLLEVPEDNLKELVNNMLSDKKQVHRLIEQVSDKKVLKVLEENISIKSQMINFEEFRKLQ